MSNVAQSPLALARPSSDSPDASLWLPSARGPRMAFELDRCLACIRLPPNEPSLWNKSTPDPMGQHFSSWVPNAKNMRTRHRQQNGAPSTKEGAALLVPQRAAADASRHMNGQHNCVL